ncbi:cyclin-like protein [Amniculicola lignicola CBS 123094]|uniref:Cyclin-like protein n=1 Tax=Amniculicola lignicola CBS 123094 TaxID=1392246 RepID=A0A6A5X1T7_9PLEO|nr:cyclin-like protein [Amniculicola lignicola CBS 123094]
MKLTEDDIYRTSTQYRHWSFTHAQLDAKRLKSNVQASERVKAAVARHRAQRNLDITSESGMGESSMGSGTETGGNTPLAQGLDAEVHCLSVTEEMKLVDTFCERALQLGSFLKFPIEVTATGIQFLRRFYLLNSPMTYEPQGISKTALFVANKTEGHHLTLEKYAGAMSKTTPEQVQAAEYIVVQALRFHFDVRHPFRGLKGAHLELIEMAHGKAATPPNSTQSAEDLQNSMSQIPRKDGGPAAEWTVSDLEKRITDAYGFASHILKTTALLTDSYFLYTPSQIWLASHLLADEPLTLFYLSTKIPSDSDLHTKLLKALRACALLLSSHHTFSPAHSTPKEKEAREKKEKQEVSALLKKLKQCRDPDKLDLVKLNQAQKRDAVSDGGDLEESKAKRRKVEREGFQKEADEFWGPELPKNGNGAKGA